MTEHIFRLESTYAELPPVFFNKLSPTPVSQPSLVIFNDKLTDEIGLNLSTMDEKDLIKLLSGNLIPDGVEPFAQAYAGHQFGNFTMLGDGRAIVLGEHITPSGGRFDIQLKGSGRTPYSRGGDGRAALGPMLREYIISEAMHSLGIPTTRSLAVVTTGERVFREDELTGAILTRVAGSHIRVGTFEFAAIQQDKAVTRALLDYLIHRHFPEIREDENSALSLLNAVIQKQADLITHWMRVGFIHGVMNTDNMALSGETIDYGPCAFMDRFAPDTVFSSIDHRGRYAYANQPHIAQWNIARLAEAILPLIHEKREKAIEMAEDSLNAFESIYKNRWLIMMCSKLGLLEINETNEKLVTDLLDLMHQNAADYTNTFLDLSQKTLPESKLFKTEEFKSWQIRWHKQIKLEDQDLESCHSLMRSVNPAVIPRNHKVEEVLTASEQGDFKPLHNLLEAVENPYQNRESLAPFQVPPRPEERVLQTFCGT